MNLRLRLRLPAGELETETTDVSEGGFAAACTPVPQVGAELGFVLHLPDDTVLSGTAKVAWAESWEGVVGMAVEFAPEFRTAWAQFIQQEAGSGGLWRMIGRYALNGGAEKEAARSVLEQGPLGLLFKNIGLKKAPKPDAAVVMRLHMVGENGEAYRIAFEKHGGLKPDDAPFAATMPGFLELARPTVARVLPQELMLKLSAHGRVQPVWVVERLRGGFAVVTSMANAKPALNSLTGNELVGIQVDAEPIFPFFTPEELDRIAHDTFRRDPQTPAPAPAPIQDRLAESYQHQELATKRPPETSQSGVRAAMAAATRVQTRTYGNRAIRLFPDLWLEVHRPGAGPVRGFAMEDRAAICVFVLEGQDAPRVMVLEPTDVVALIRRGA